MKFSWLMIASLLFSGNAFADDEKAKTDEKSKPKVETKASVTVMVIGEDGKVITKSISESGDQEENKVKVEILDGKKLIEVTLPDGTKKKVNIGAVEAEANGTAGRVMRWVFRKDGEDATDPEKISEVKERVEEMLKNVDVDVKIDAKNIAKQVEAAMIRIKPLMLEEKEFAGEMLLELSDSAFIVQEDVEGVEADGENLPRKRIQVRRLGSQESGMAAVLKKLEEMSQRLEKIEARLDQLSKE